ncbi:hypothetical protein IL306_014866, partial [Fusarium sp. DS 682]
VSQQTSSRRRSPAPSRANPSASMGEMERLREQLREAQRLREEEQRLREEEQRRCEAAEGRALEEQHQREEEQRRREEAEERADASRPIDTPTISRNMPFAQPCYRNNNRPFLDDTRGHDEPDRPNLSSTNYPVDYIRKGTRKSLEPTFVQSLVFFPTRLSILTSAGLCEVPASPGQKRHRTPK